MERRKRYERNGISVNPAENAVLAGKRAAVIGAGGLGGHVAEMLLRVGLLRLTIIDCDSFDETNLNRQLFSVEAGLGKLKVEEAEKRLLAVDSQAQITAFSEKLDAANATRLLAGCDIVVDALDNIESRRIAAAACEELGIPFVHGAIGGWYAQVSVVMPGSGGLAAHYGSSQDSDVDKSLGNMPYIAALTASIQCVETVKTLLGKKPNLQGRTLRLDLMNYEFDIF
ncbi:MAG: HesA/MoeB/ThiF family protein [Spirochaetes bacterium]|nr:HesA/MoeB/ThiF family protein [Spirochaetota bacterium]